MLQLIGRMPGLVLYTDDCRKTIDELKAQDIKILLEPVDCGSNCGFESLLHELVEQPCRRL